VAGVIGLLIVGFAVYLWVGESTRDEAAGTAERR
jgi:hypothetical protein